MRIVFHEKYKLAYSHDPAAKAGRIENIVEALKDYEFVTPEPAAEEDLLLVHSQPLIDSVKSNELVFEIASLAAGGAIATSENYDIIGVSAGFDTYEKDWGRSLRTGDYETIGNIIREAAKSCRGRRFTLLEGGYYVADLGRNVRSFLEGLE